MAWKWFGVRTFYRWEAKGRPRRPAAHYDPDMTLVEDRLVLIRARGHKEAIRKGEREAQRYAKDAFTNPFGERVRLRYLGVCDAGEIYDDLGPSAELFSDTHAISRDVSDSAAVERFRGPELTADEERRRDKFVDAEFLAEIRRRRTSA